MKKLLFLFSSLFCLVLFSQENLPSGQLLIAKDSISFYSFVKTGVYEFTIQNNGLNKVFSEYSSPLPSEIKNIPLRDLKGTRRSHSYTFDLGMKQEVLLLGIHT